MEIRITATSKEIADLALALQDRRKEIELMEGAIADHLSKAICDTAPIKIASN